MLAAGGRLAHLLEPGAELLETDLGTVGKLHIMRGRHRGDKHEGNNTDTWGDRQERRNGTIQRG